MPSSPNNPFLQRDDQAQHVWKMQFIYSDAFHQFIELIPEAVIFSNIEGKIILTNSKARELFQYSQQELPDLTIEDLVPNETKNDHPKLRELFFKNPYPRFLSTRELKLTAKKKDGSVFPMDAALFSLQTNNGPLAINMIRDISDQHNYQKQLSEYAFVDALTQLPNRRYFSENLKRNTAKAKRHNNQLALLFIDLDKFKQINDNFGHETGDLVLQKVAARLSKTLREEDFLSRIGGDEFVVMLYPVDNIAATSIVANKIISQCTKPILIDNQEFVVGASIGISIYNNNNLDANTLLKQADQAMYAAKGKGGNCFILYSELVI